MLCRRCTRLLKQGTRIHLNPASQSQSQHQYQYQQRSLSSTPLHQSDNPPAATSTSAAQPFSTPHTPSPAHQDVPSPSSTTTTTTSTAPSPAQPPRSSVPAGTPLRLSFLKHSDAPLAKEDHEYPSWLWTLLEQPKRIPSSSGTTSASVPAGPDSGNIYAKSKKQRRKAARLAREAAASEESGGIEGLRVPLEQQSVDLPGGMGVPEGTDARVAQAGLRVAMREARRKRIKEGNFLKGMR